MKTVVIVFPGASLMDITPDGGGLRVRCPGCGREQVYDGGDAAEFVHESGCDVERRVRNGLTQSKSGPIHG